MNKLMRMKRLIADKYKSKQRITAARLYTIIGGIFIIFLIGMATFQNIDVYEVRTEPKNNIVQSPQMTEVVDENTPLGVKKQYKWKLGDLERWESSLTFYIVHQYVEVYFDGELMYSLDLKKENKVGQTPGNNWVMIPLFPEDEGTEVCVNIIPVYEQVLNRQPEFFVGSKFNVYRNQFKLDLPQILLSLIAIAVGILFVTISIIHRLKVKKGYELIYLGIFSFTIGLWKLTDIRFAALIFTRNTMAVSYISISMILLSVVPLLLIVKKQFLNVYSRLIDIIISIYCTIAFLIILAQITNVADFRETLYIVHMQIAIISIFIVVMVIYEVKSNRANKSAKRLYGYLLICVIGAIMDMVIYYIQGHSSGILCTLMAFLIYIISMGYMFIKDTNHRANIDIHTGLFNKSRCNEILEENQVVKKSVGIIMFDLNHLKYTNDTFGHEKGDIIISEFAYILRENISSRNFVGRYGGDEFIVVIKDADTDKIEEIRKRISAGIARYNLKNSEIPISYSMGYSLALDYQGLTLRELLKEADNYMYKNKKVYHEKNY